MQELMYRCVDNRMKMGFRLIIVAVIVYNLTNCFSRGEGH